MYNQQKAKHEGYERGFRKINVAPEDIKIEMVDALRMRAGIYHNEDDEEEIVKNWTPGFGSTKYMGRDDNWGEKVKLDHFEFM